ncbi:hypothetical protein [Streptomyces chryseus]|uniref:hypothetical protein n=1 Tax=Streptomyces chryseus TaxID=68186 RepID=UPI00110FA9ED|nr:hypothetical protein [Streptomyces chryseus]GGX18690.1 hypothetical protein GCM10010353_37340 [Streptomyces chryseus]
MAGVRWRAPGVAARGPDRVPWAYSTAVVCAVVFTGAMGLLPMLGVAGQLHHPATALAAYCALLAFVGFHARPRVIPLAAVVCWLCYDGFVIHQQGELDWDGLVDVYRLAALAGASLLGTTAASVSHAIGVRRA